MFKQHVNTPRYSKDAATKQYVDTAISRIQPGASSSVFDYRVDTTNTSANDPGAGKYKYSTVTQNQATTLYMDWLTQDGFDVVAMFTTMKFGDSFIIQDKDMSVNYQKWKLLGPAVIMPDWFQVPVQFIEGDAVFSNNQMVSFVVTYVGQPGEQGEDGEQGIPGAQGPIGPAGPGVAAGGSAGQVLTKVDSANYNTYWAAGGSSDYVLKTGDTMTGILQVNQEMIVKGGHSGGYGRLRIDCDVGYSSALTYRLAGVDKWEIGVSTLNWLTIACSGVGAALACDPATVLCKVVGDPTEALGIATKQYVDSKVVSGAYLPLSGGSMTGRIGLSNSGLHISSADNIVARVNSGFYQTSSGTIAEGWPYDGGWFHLISCTHSNDANYYSMQLAMSFASTDNKLYFRQTDGGGGAAWRTAWDNYSINAGSLSCMNFRYASPGAGGWYEANNGNTQRFFIGTEGQGDEWRIYTQGGGNVFRVFGSNNNVAMAGSVQVGTLDCLGNAWVKGNTLYLSAAGHYIQWAENYYYHFPHGNLHSQGKWVARNGDDVTFNECTTNSNFHSNGNHYFIGPGWMRWRGDLGRIDTSHGWTIPDLNTGAINCTSIYTNGYEVNCGQSRSYGTKTRQGWSGAHTSNSFNFDWRYNYMIGYIDDSDLGGVMMTSDYRVKKDVIELPSTWDAVKRLKPISFTYKDWVPPNSTTGEKLFVDSDIVHWGFFAHELQEVLTEGASSGVKDDPKCVQSPNELVVIAAITKALQEAMSRIERNEREIEWLKNRVQ